MIHDPALILVTVGMLTATGAWLAKRRRQLFAEDAHIGGSTSATTAISREVIEVG